MKATIITIGDEILIGQIVDTNSASIARHLNAAGIVVAEKESVGDDRDAIVAALRRAMDGSDVTILTGGLGPTKDDITKRTLAELFGCELVRDERVARHVCCSTPTARLRACGSNATAVSWSRCRACRSKWNTSCRTK